MLRTSCRRYPILLPLLLAAGGCSGDVTDTSGPTVPGPAALAATATHTPSTQFFHGPVSLAVDSATIARIEAADRAAGADSVARATQGLRPSFSIASDDAGELPGTFDVDFEDVTQFSLRDAYLSRGIVLEGGYLGYGYPAFPAHSGQRYMIGPSLGLITMRFAKAVDSVRIFVTSPYSFQFSCEGFRPDGSYGTLAFIELPGRSLSTPISPYPVNEELTIRSPGILVCKIQGRSYGYTVDDIRWGRGGVAPTVAPTVALSCLGPDSLPTVTRGDTVSCTARVLSPTPTSYTLLRWTAVGEDGHSHQADVGEVRPPGAESRWEGPAVLSTSVTVRVQIAGRTDTLSQTAQYTVTSRPWQVRLTGRPRVEYAALDSMPEPSRSQASLDGVFGELELWPHKPESVAGVGAAGRGPNAIWLYLREPLPPTDPVVRLNARMEPSHPWYRAQDGRRRPGARLFTCSSTDLERIRAQVLEHEGARSGSRPSHYGVWERELPSHDLDLQIEPLHAHALDEGQDSLAARVRRVRQAWERTMNELHQRQVDALDSLVIRCDFNSTSTR